jgi:cysteine-rich repeat protein
MNIFLIFGLLAIRVASAVLPTCDDATFDSYMKNFSEFVCNSVCGDGLVTSIYEGCDLGANNNKYSGCSNTCKVAHGYACTRFWNIMTQGPNTCKPICGDNYVVGNGAEACDSNEGCDSTCQPAKGYTCSGMMLLDTNLYKCVPKCGDGMVQLSGDSFNSRTPDERCDVGGYSTTFGFYNGGTRALALSCSFSFFLFYSLLFSFLFSPIIISHFLFFRSPGLLSDSLGCTNKCQIKNDSWPTLQCVDTVKSCAALATHICGDGIKIGTRCGCRLQY